jgi:hypothetical protein
MEFVIALFCKVDTHLQDIPKHLSATLRPGEVVTLGLLHALKGVDNRMFIAERFHIASIFVGTP